MYALINFIFFILPISAVVYLVIYIMQRNQIMAKLKDDVGSLTTVVEELDYQAKLIVKSDMELKLYQEEVEDKLNKLTLLKNLIISSVNILDREDLFTQIDEKIISDLGFSKGLILKYDDLTVKNNMHYSPEEIEKIKHFLSSKKQLLAVNLLATSEFEPCKELVSSLQCKDFMIAFIKAYENIHAIFIISHPELPTGIRDEERATFSIICMYLGQCLDNIKFFEELYLAKDELEKKVKERTNELVKSLREIEVISKTKSDFISAVSHELRTPLTSVKGFSSLLIDEKFGVLPPEAKKRLEKIDENVNKLVDMVNALLDIARIESGKTELKIAPCDLTKLVKDTADFLLPQMQEKGIKFITQLPDDLVAYFDKNLMERVFINLINNSIKFTPSGGIITVKYRKEDNRNIISLSDTGCGMSRDDLSRLFSEFFRANNPVNTQVRGTGLGLSLVKKIIESHKEKIWVESELGQGTTFSFTIKLFA